MIIYIHRKYPIARIADMSYQLLESLGMSYLAPSQFYQ